MRNFTDLVGDDVFRAALSNSLWFAAIAVPVRLLLALGLALLLHRRAAVSHLSLRCRA
jgi:multiple sugar transport system permease protein